VKTHHYSQAAAGLRAELSRELPRDLLVQLHTRTAWRHLLIAARQFAILGLATWGLITISNPLIWIPLAFVQGFTVFNFTVLLHEVVHHAIFE
jgi:fatty acid desaturase